VSLPQRRAQFFGISRVDARRGLCSKRRGEVDLDLENYERYLNVTFSHDNNITTGKNDLPLLGYQIKRFVFWITRNHRRHLTILSERGKKNSTSTASQRAKKTSHFNSAKEIDKYSKPEVAKPEEEAAPLRKSQWWKQNML